MGRHSTVKLLESPDEEEDEHLLEYEFYDEDEGQDEHTRGCMLVAIFFILFGASSFGLAYLIPSQYLLQNQPTEPNNNLIDVPYLPGEWSSLPQTNHFNASTKGGNDWSYFKWNSGHFIGSEGVHRGQEVFHACVDAGQISAYIKMGDIPTASDDKLAYCGDGMDLNTSLHICHPQRWVYIGLKNKDVSEGSVEFSLRSSQKRSEKEGRCEGEVEWGTAAIVFLIAGIVLGFSLWTASCIMLCFCTRRIPH